MKTNIAIVLSIIATGTGGFGAYTAWQANKFRQPLDKHQQVAMSFKDQISSAEHRGDNSNANIVRIEYEKYEKSWRDSQFLERVTASIRSLDMENITETKRTEISNALNKITNSYAVTTASPEAFGAAYYALGEYKKAAEQLGVALATNPSDNNIRALQAASLVSASNLSNHDSASLKIQALELVSEKDFRFTEKQKHFLLNTNDESIRMALKKSANK